MTRTRLATRRLQRGPVAVELDYDGQHVILRCTEHGIEDRVEMLDDDLGGVLGRFFADHESCSRGALFEIDDASLAG
jgi:hypothetical protein